MWTEACQNAFETLKGLLTEMPVMARPDLDKPFLVHTDWSSLGLGAVLAQVDAAGYERVIVYASRSNNRAKANYSSYEGECLAVVWAVSHFRPYLYGRCFTLLTDHQPLKWVMTNNKLSGKLARWAMLLQEYDFEVVHKSGLCHQKADALSRSPSDNTQDLTEARQDHENDTCITVAGLVTMICNTTCLATDLQAGNGDIWEDQAAMQYLQNGQHMQASTGAQKERIQQRARRYVWRDGHLVRTLSSGGERLVPPPHERVALIHRVHDDLGHFGIKRTYSLLVPHFFWRGCMPRYGTWFPDVSSAIE